MLALLVLALLPLIFGAPPMGGWSDCTSGYPQKEIEAFLATALANQDQPLTFKGIEKCRQQLVAGMNFRLVVSVENEDREFLYRITVHRSLTGEYSVMDDPMRGKGRFARGDERPTRPGRDERPWMEGGAHRQPKRPTRVGSFVPLDVTSDLAQSVASYAVMMLNRQSNSAFEMGVGEILSASRQLVNGANFDLRIRVQSLDENGEKTNDLVQVVHVRVYQSFSDAKNGEFSSFQLLPNIEPK